MSEKVAVTFGPWVEGNRPGETGTCAVLADGVMVGHIRQASKCAFWWGDTENEFRLSSRNRRFAQIDVRSLVYKWSKA